MIKKKMLKLHVQQEDARKTFDQLGNLISVVD